MRFDIRYQCRFTYDQLVRESQNELRACPASDDRQQLVAYRVHDDAVGAGALVHRLVGDAGRRLRCPRAPPRARRRRRGDGRDVAARRSSPSTPVDGLRRAPASATTTPSTSSARRTRRGATHRRAGRAAGPTLAGAGVVSRVLAIHRGVALALTYAPGSTYVGVDVDEVLDRGRGRVPGLRPPRGRHRAAPSASRPATCPATCSPSDDATRRRRRRRRGRCGCRPTPGSRPPSPASAGSALDPTNGLEVGHRHVKIGHGRDYDDVPPLRGVYAGGTRPRPRGRRRHPAPRRPSGRRAPAPAPTPPPGCSRRTRSTRPAPRRAGPPSSSNSSSSSAEGYRSGTGHSGRKGEMTNRSVLLAMALGAGVDVASSPRRARRRRPRRGGTGVGLRRHRVPRGQRGGAAHPGRASDRRWRRRPDRRRRPRPTPSPSAGRCTRTPPCTSSRISSRRSPHGPAVEGPYNTRARPRRGARRAARHADDGVSLVSADAVQCRGRASVCRGGAAEYAASSEIVDLQVGGNDIPAQRAGAGRHRRHRRAAGELGPGGRRRREPQRRHAARGRRHRRRRAGALGHRAGRPGGDRDDRPCGVDERHRARPVTGCADGIDNDDPEDTLADADDPAATPTATRATPRATTRPTTTRPTRRRRSAPTASTTTTRRTPSPMPTTRAATPTATPANAASYDPADDDEHTDPGPARCLRSREQQPAQTLPRTGLGPSALGVGAGLALAGALGLALAAPPPCAAAQPVGRE